MELNGSSHWRGKKKYNLATCHCKAVIPLIGQSSFTPKTRSRASGSIQELASNKQAPLHKPMTSLPVLAKQSTPTSPAVETESTTHLYIWPCFWYPFQVGLTGANTETSKGSPSLTQPNDLPLPFLAGRIKRHLKGASTRFYIAVSLLCNSSSTGWLVNQIETNHFSSLSASRSRSSEAMSLAVASLLSSCRCKASSSCQFSVSRK